MANQAKTEAGGQPCVILTSAEGGRAEVYLQGAHVARWTRPGGDEVLFLSPRSRFEPGQAIRGGIPIIFPQFADQGPLPKHGFARTAVWSLADSSPGSALLALEDSDATRAVWDFAFRAELRVRLGAELELSLAVHNTGGRAFEFTCALHAYLAVGDVRRAAVDGLAGLRCRDKVAGGEHVETEPRVRFGGEVDRVYLDAPDQLRLEDQAGGRVVAVRKRGFPDAVVWNPGAEKAREMADLGDEAALRFACVEAACAGAPVRLEPGARWEGGQAITVE